MPIAWHGPFEQLKPGTRDMAMAIQSLMEELEAVDWYGQRMDLAGDDELRRILEHNRDEEKEHASMLLEWIRRRDPKFNDPLRTYLFTSSDIIGIEHSQSAENKPASEPAPHMPVTVAAGDAPVQSPAVFTVGSLRPKKD